MFKWLFIALFLVRFPLCGRQIDQNNDFQVWLTQPVCIKIQEKTDAYITTEIRFGDMASKAYFMYVEPRLEFLVSSHFSWGPGYRQIYRFRPLEKKWVLEYSPLIDFFFRGVMYGWEIADRSQFMYIFRPDLRDTWLYRNRLSLLSPWVLGSMKIRPFFYEEVFFDQKRHFYENRLFLGGVLRFSKHVTSNVGYILRYLKGFDNRWTRQHVLNLITNFSF